MTKPSMTPEQWARVQAVFHHALAREAFLDRACSHDHDLRAEVLSLLAAHEESGPLAMLSDDDAPALRVAGEQIGPYRIVRMLGQGDMGTVYRPVSRVPIRCRLSSCSPPSGPARNGR